MDTNGQNYQTRRSEAMDGNVENKFVILAQEVIGNKNLTLAERIILARITGFKVFYESNEATGEFLGISPEYVKKSKQKLEKLGYIVAIENSGHGKKYAPDFNKILVCRDNLSPLPGQFIPPEGINHPPENKLKNKEKNKEGGDNAAEGAENSKKEYGRADVNELAELWESETGISIKGQQNERRQLYNLLRKYGCEATKTLVRRVGATKRSHDRFAPQIAVPSDLTGKYSKLPRMQMWEERNKASRSFGQPANPTLAAIKGNEGWNAGAWEEPSDEERERVRQMFKKKRDELFG